LAEDPVFASYAFFLPPTFRNVPTWPRLRESSKGAYDASNRHRDAFVWDRYGTDSTIGAVTYRGGYWAGPLSPVEVTAITGAGLGSRIVTSVDPQGGDLPPGLDPF
jgi:hypothetical protein